MIKRVTLFFSPTTLFKKYTEKQSPPLSIAYLAQYLQMHNYEVYSINPNNYLMFNFSTDVDTIEQLVLQRSIQEIESSDPDVLLISSWTYGMPFTIELVRELKQRNPSLPIILGGRNATFLPEQTLGFIPQVDYLVRGEGQQTLVELFDAFNKNLPASSIKGLTYRNQGKIVHTPDREFMGDVSQLPLLDFSSFDCDGISDFYLLASLGCPYKCSFCSDTALWKKYNFYSVEYVKKQIEVLQQKFGDIRITFWDSNFTMVPSWGKKFAESIKGLGLHWSCYSRIDNIYPELTSSLKSSGLDWMYFGIESLSPKTLSFFTKHPKPHDYIAQVPKSLTILESLGIKPVVSNILGSPKETKEELHANVDLMNSLREQFPSIELEVSLLTLEINSPLWYEYKKGRLQLFKTKNSMKSYGFAGFQLFADKYNHSIELTPQEYFFRSDHMDDETFEEEVITTLKEMYAIKEQTVLN